MVDVVVWSVVVPAKRLAVAKTRLRPLTAGGPSARAAHDEVGARNARRHGRGSAGQPRRRRRPRGHRRAGGRAPVVGTLGATTVAGRARPGAEPGVAGTAPAFAGSSAVAALSSDLPALRPARAPPPPSPPPSGRPACFRRRRRRHRDDAAHCPRHRPATRRFGHGSARAHRGAGATALTGAWPGLTPRRRHGRGPPRRAGPSGSALGRRPSPGASGRRARAPDLRAAGIVRSPFTRVRHDGVVPPEPTATGTIDAPSPICLPTVPQPRDVLAGLQRAGAGAGRGRRAAAARAGEVPRDLRQQPRRVLHGPRRRPQAAAEHRPRRPLRRRPRHPRAARR